jgi:hypothetical protein
MIDLLSLRSEPLLRLLSFATLSLCIQRHHHVTAQIGVTICACQPRVYTFELNFTSLCPDTNILENPGILDVDCFQRGVGVNADLINDTIPTQINNINVLELGSEREPISITPYPRMFSDGSTFEYTSPILGSIADLTNLTVDSFPAGLQIDLTGINREEQPITNVWIIMFTNDCDFYPVLDIGDNIGWTTLVRTMV